MSCDPIGCVLSRKIQGRGEMETRRCGDPEKRKRGAKLSAMIIIRWIWFCGWCCDTSRVSESKRDKQLNAKERKVHSTVLMTCISACLSCAEMNCGSWRPWEH